MTRFRGMISTQPGSTPLASFKILSLEEAESHGSYCSGNDIGRMSHQLDVLRLYVNRSHEGLTDTVTCKSDHGCKLLYTALPLKRWQEIPFRLCRVSMLTGLSLKVRKKEEKFLITNAVLFL